jgi:hypothetical protein
MEIPEPSLKPKTTKKRAPLPSARTKQFFQKLGFDIGDTEQKLRIPGRGMITRDLFGFADLVAIHPQLSGSWFIQTTTRPHAANRIQKALINPVLPRLLLGGNRFVVQSWAKQKKKSQTLHWWSKIEALMLGNSLLPFPKADPGLIEDATHIWKVEQDFEEDDLDGVSLFILKDLKQEKIAEVHIEVAINVLEA